MAADRLELFGPVAAGALAAARGHDHGSNSWHADSDPFSLFWLSAFRGGKEIVSEFGPVLGMNRFLHCSTCAAL
jgi:hypothetical protein